MPVFGPVPSRRLGRSLGVNNIPPKRCTYSCVYCQVGRTPRQEVERRSFFPPAELCTEVIARVRECRTAGEPLDWVTFVPDGEPTLDVHLGEEIRAIRPHGVPVAVITNGSLLHRDDVRAEVAEANWVSVKVDAVDPATFRRVDRPHPSLDPDTVLDGVATFAGQYRGTLVTETMLVRGLNDSPGEAERIADFLAGIRPAAAYLAVPTRPPAEAWVEPPEEAAVLSAFEAFRARGLRVELLIGWEGGDVAATGDPRQDLLAITSVHPLRDEAVDELLAKGCAGRELLDEMVARGEVLALEHAGHRFWVRRFPGIHGRD